MDLKSEHLAVYCPFLAHGLEGISRTLLPMETADSSGKLSRFPHESRTCFPIRSYIFLYTIASAWYDLPIGSTVTCRPLALTTPTQVH